MGSKPHQPGEGCIRHSDSSISDAGFFDLDDDESMSRAEIIRTRERMLDQGMSQADVDKYLPLD